jgi:hypothetical protein
VEHSALRPTHFTQDPERVPAQEKTMSMEKRAVVETEHEKTARENVTKKNKPKADKSQAPKKEKK